MRINQKPIYQSVSLAETLYRYFAVDLEKSHRQIFTKNWNGVWTDELANHALSDVVHLPELKREQELGLSVWVCAKNLRDKWQRLFEVKFLKVSANLLLQFVYLRLISDYVRRTAYFGRTIKTVH